MGERQLMRTSRGYFTLAQNKCAKKEVTAVLITKDGGDPSFFIARNLCSNGQEVCPREEGEDYTKCKTICKQEGHAEVVVLKKAKKRAINSIIVLMGHDHCCEDCIDAMKKAGVSEVIIV